MLSSKRIKKYTREELGFDLSSNAFGALKDQIEQFIKTCEYEADQLDDWIMRVLKAAGKLEKPVVRKQDIEAIFDEIQICECFKAVEEENMELESDAKNEKSDEEPLKEIDEIQSAEMENVEWREVEIIQLPTRFRDSADDDLNEDGLQAQEEIERLKKIIQIILNKQAELT